MKLRHFALALLFASVNVFAQIDEQKEVIDTEIVDDSNSSDKIVDMSKLDKQPEFPGGLNSLMKFLSENITYPTKCAEKEIQGRVLVRFTVFKDGTVGNIEVLRSVHPLLDAEAKRLVSLLPKWTPGELNGQPVNVWFLLPINFKL